MQSATENVFVYVARQSYKGTGKNDPSFEVNDVIHVTADFLHRQNINPESPDGWLLGKNVRTGQEGYFPGYFLVLNGSQLRMPRCRPPPDISGNSQVYMNLGWNSASSTGEDSGYISAAQHNSSLSSTPHTGSRRSSSGQSSPSVQHNLAPAYFLTPVLCVHCKYDRLRLMQMSVSTPQI
ncbi:uncharacterized protein LOC125038207 [Penaeus chinensis]|uniref:uncharacterized protein LOC125038207 n=1 Tax=Penaeus chinensis TaxID=139456 RepID=UPI001FB659C1|nr:uncharacterized protein LOC125038207 [Penaeus chinensis]XP_047487568.1 uncharacterized protein LOC125038207 [Penaeus chinensis]XP_047487569.1 uncharacterized protein LOC125038207 [Penaeus chinensis]XP_047487570.1 uncharacterized protein LOC125038207 [Penaeus chinensis]